MYYPLTSMLSLFANLIQGSPHGPHVVEDLKLMDIVTSFLSPTAIPLSPFAASPSMEIFHELNRVAKRFVEKSNQQDTKNTKRMHEDIDSEHSKSQQPGNEPDVASTESCTDTTSVTFDSKVCIPHLITVQVHLTRST
jgi:hypothetical protein